MIKLKSIPSNYIRYTELDGLNLTNNEIIRANIFYNRLLNSQRTTKLKYRDEYDGITYIDSITLKSYLGDKTYTKILKEMEEKGLISKNTNFVSKFKKTLNFFNEVKELTGKRVKLEDKKIKNSLSKDFRTKYNKLSNDALIVLSNMYLTKFNITEEEIDVVLNDSYIEYLEKPLKRGKSKLSKIIYIEGLQFVKQLINDFNEAKSKLDYLQFINEDDFSGRVHTIFSVIPSNLRKYIKLEGVSVREIDLVTSQPTILSSLLNKELPGNSFTDYFNETPDFYTSIQQDLDLTNRITAKLKTFGILFGRVTSSNHKIMVDMFPDIKEWLETVKTTPNKDNSSNKVHSNLAWILQIEERKMFGEIWRELNRNFITFIPVHDSVIVPADKYELTYEIMNIILTKYLPKFSLK